MCTLRMMKEAQLFELIKLSFISDLTKITFAQSRYDCYSDKWKMVIELKCRKKHYDKLIIERGKYDALLKVAEEKGYKPFYINSTPNAVYAFDLLAVEIEWGESKWLPKHTEFSQRHNVLKEIGYIDISQAKIISE